MNWFHSSTTQSELDVTPFAVFWCRRAVGLFILAVLLGFNVCLNLHGPLAKPPDKLPYELDSPGLVEPPAIVQRARVPITDTIVRDLTSRAAPAPPLPSSTRREDAPPVLLRSNAGHSAPQRNFGCNLTAQHRLAFGVPFAKRDTPIVAWMLQQLTATMAADVCVESQLSFASDAAAMAPVVAAVRAFGVPVTVGPAHADMDNPIPLTLGDSAERVRWRSQQTLDFAAMLEHMLRSTRAPVIVLMEDDVLPAKNLGTILLDSIATNAARGSLPSDWGYISLYHGRKEHTYALNTLKPLPRGQACGMCGAVAFAYRREELSGLASELRARFYRMPVDWLVGDFLAKSRRLPTFEHVPNLVQHMGLRSTFAGNGAERSGFKTPSFVLDALQSVPEAGSTAAVAARLEAAAFVGCFPDQRDADRDLTGLFDAAGADGRGSHVGCARFCRHFRYFALQYGGECYCGNEYGRHGGPMDPAACAMPCARAPGCALRCGGVLVNAVFR